VLITVARTDHGAVLEAARQFQEMGFRILATEGTRAHLAERGVTAELVHKLNEGHPDITEVMAKGGVQLVVNTPIGRASLTDDSYIRKAAIKHKIPYITTTAAALAAARGIAAYLRSPGEVKSVQEYHRDLNR